MRRLLLLVILALVALPALAVSRTVLVVDDVIRMSKAGVGDDEIIAFVKKTREPFDVTGDDVIAMTDAHVSHPVIKAVIDESAARMRDERRRDVEPAARTVYVSPYAYDPYWSWGYDPWFYGPRLTFGYYGSWGGFRGGFRGGIHHGRHH